MFKIPTWMCDIQTGNLCFEICVGSAVVKAEWYLEDMLFVMRARAAPTSA